MALHAVQKFVATSIFGDSESECHLETDLSSIIPRSHLTTDRIRAHGKMAFLPILSRTDKKQHYFAKELPFSHEQKKKKLKVISKRPSKRIAAKFAKTRAIFKICIPDQCKTARSLQHLDSNAAVTKSINSSSYFLTDTLFDRRF